MHRDHSLRVRRGRLLALYAVCCLPLIGYGAWRAAQTNSNSPLTWVPASFPPRAEYDRFVEQFGTGEVVVASWPGCTIDEPKLDLLLQTLAEDAAFQDAAGNSYFERVTCGRKIVDGLTIGPFPIERERAVDRFRGSLIGKDGRQTCIVVAFTPAALQDRDRLVRELIGRICSRFQLGEEDVHLAGPVIDGWSVDRAGRASLEKLALPSMAIMLLLACLCLKSWRDGLIVFGLAAFCQAATLALVFFSGESMNALLIVLPPLIQVLAIAGGIHLTNYYTDSLSVHGAREAPWQAVQKGWLPCLLSAGTTALGIASLMASDLTPIRSFGVFGSAGVMLTFGVLLLGVPAVWLMWPKRASEPRRPLEPADASGGLSAAATNWLARQWPLVLALALVALAAGGFFFKDVRTSVRIETLFGGSSRILQDYRWIEEHVAPLVAIDVVVVWREEAPSSVTERLTRVWKIQRAIAKVQDVGGSLSAVQLVPAAPSASEMPRDFYEEALERFLDALRPEFAKAGCLSEADGRQQWRISARVSATSQADYREILDRLREAVEAEVAADAAAEQIDVHYTGVMPLVHDVQRQLMRDLIQSFLGALLVITIVMTLSQGSIAAGVIAMIPNVFPIVVVFGFLGWRGMPIDIGTVMTASVALGIAVDDTLHFLTFFQRASREGAGRRAAVQYAFRHCAKAMIQTSVVCGCGLLVFGFSDFLPTSRFAWLMVALILLALVGDLCILPAILLSPLGRLFVEEERPLSPPSDGIGSPPPQQLLRV